MGWRGRPSKGWRPERGHAVTASPCQQRPQLIRRRPRSPRSCPPCMARTRSSPWSPWPSPLCRGRKPSDPTGSRTNPPHKGHIAPAPPWRRKSLARKAALSPGSRRVQAMPAFTHGLLGACPAGTPRSMRSPRRCSYLLGSRYNQWSQAPTRCPAGRSSTTPSVRWSTSQPGTGRTTSEGRPSQTGMGNYPVRTLGSRSQCEPRQLGS